MNAELARKFNEVLRARREGQATAANFPACDFVDLIAIAADLAGANFEGANLEGACLAGAKLTRANLRNVSLRGADLDGADLTEADLSGADLTGARLDDIVLTRAKLRNTCLEATVGEALSMSGALVDKTTIERSGFRMREIAQLVIRGADVRENESIPPSIREAVSSKMPSIVPGLRVREANSRGLRADENDQVPVSLRAFESLNALIKEARTSDAPPPSRRGGLMAAVPQGPDAPAAPERLEPGMSYLGFALKSELEGGTASRAFLATDADGKMAVVRLFDENVYGAELQLPAFQRGVRALNKAQGLEGVQVAELLAVSCDQTGYVTRHYSNGSLENLVDVAMTMQAGTEIIRSLATTIDGLNRAGILVRAIKPSNVLIDGLDPLVGEIDAVDLPTLACQRGDIYGYGSYAAPEELLGNGTRSPTADVYALGKLLDFLLTGHEPIAPVGAPPVIADQAGMPQGLIDIVKRCIGQEPSERYQYVSELLEDLTAFERKGARAVLKASLRPGAAKAKAKGPMAAAVKPPKLAQQPLNLGPFEPQGWFKRRTELLLASAGVLAAAATAAVLWISPSSVDSLERLPQFASPLIAMAVWFLPVPRQRTRLLRLISWASLALLIYTINPIQIAGLRWRYDLKNGTSAQKDAAVRRLVRIGFRDFQGLDLKGAYLRNVDLSSTDFTGANLDGADMQDSFGMGLVLDEAHIRGLRLGGADLRGASLRNTKFSRQAQCSGMTRLPKTHYCRNGFLRPRRTTKK